MAEIIPTILTADFSDYFERLNSLPETISRIHIDIIDGRFAPNRTISLEALKNQETNLKLDLHLMVKEPEEWIKRALEILPERLIGQVEMMTDPWEFLNQTIESGMEAGIGVDLTTPVGKLSSETYHLADLVLLMAVKAGSGGQEFDQAVLGKIKKMKEITGDLVKIGVDGGLDEKTIPLCRQAGADIFYVGSSFWQEKDLEKRYRQLLKLVT
ncbi:MAG TPA: hypothetical protein VMW25_04040 [Clostridia bacterium]|nr:hypothetical protein [Clostridia bacterium]